VAKIIVTRPRDRAQELATRLRRLGHEVEVRPLIATVSLGDEPIDVSAYDWVIVTSARGARELRRRARGKMPRVAAIGRATARAMGGADLVPQVATQEGLLAEFPRGSGRVLFAGAEGARELISVALGADVVALYRTRELAVDALPECDLVVLASASAARALARLGASAPIVSIGPETTRVAKEKGLVVAAEAETHDLDGLVAAVEAAVRDAS
jgi:uroporphyrinogen III methyltransferase / synthase